MNIDTEHVIKRLREKSDVLRRMRRNGARRDAERIDSRQHVGAGGCAAIGHRKHGVEARELAGVQPRAAANA